MLPIAAATCSITTARPKGQGSISGVVGERLANSFHPTKGDKATGALTSPKFAIDRPHMSLRIGGFKGGHAKKLEVARLIRAAGLPLTLNLVVLSSLLLNMGWDRVVFFGAVIAVMTFTLNGG